MNSEQLAGDQGAGNEVTATEDPGAPQGSAHRKKI